MNATAIEIKNLSKVFHRNTTGLHSLLSIRRDSPVLALEGIDLSILEGEVFALVGRNGQGKTTLLKIISGLVEPTSGSVRVFGLDPIGNPREVKRKIGLVTSDERSFYWRLTGFQNLVFFSRLHGMAKTDAIGRIRKLVEFFEMKDLIHRRFNEFSAGNKQRLSIMRALLPGPRMLLFDEPTRSLDPVSARNLKRLIVEWMRETSGRTVVLTTHHLEDAEELCTRVGILHRNKLVASDTIANLQEKFPVVDRITLKTNGKVNSNCLDAIRGKAPGLALSSSGDNLTEWVFPSRNGVPTLNFVITSLVENGIEVVECETKHSGLNGIMGEIERRGDQEE